MKISYDAEVDALSITSQETTVTTKHLAEGIAADYDSKGQTKNPMQSFFVVLRNILTIRSSLGNMTNIAGNKDLCSK